MGTRPLDYIEDGGIAEQHLKDHMKAGEETEKRRRKELAVVGLPYRLPKRRVAAMTAANRRKK